MTPSTTRRATVSGMSRKKKNPPPAKPESISPVDEAEFTDVIRKMVNTSPVTRKAVESGVAINAAKTQRRIAAICQCSISRR